MIEAKDLGWSDREDDAVESTEALASSLLSPSLASPKQTCEGLFQDLSCSDPPLPPWPGLLFELGVTCVCRGHSARSSGGDKPNFFSLQSETLHGRTALLGHMPFPPWWVPFAVTRA